MKEEKKHRIMLGIEVVLFCMIVAILGTNAASSNPPSNGVSYGKNNQTTVEGALNDLYTKANYGNASASQILSGKTALVGGSKVTGTMANQTSATGITLTSSDKRPIKKVTKQAGDARIWHVTNSDGVSRLAIGVPASGYYDTNVALAIENADLASAIGLTAGKLLKGQTVLGITGTGETTCPTCESQGYWKIYKFKDLEATCINGDCLANSWFSSAKEKNIGCNSKGENCVTDDYYRSEIIAKLDLDYKEILAYNVDLGCFEPGSDCIRYSKAKSESGGASKTTSAMYPSTVNPSGYNSLSIRGSSDRDMDGGFVIPGRSDTACWAKVNSFVGDGEVRVKFDYPCWTNNWHWSPIELKGEKYRLSGYIIYR